MVAQSDAKTHNRQTHNKENSDVDKEIRPTLPGLTLRDQALRAHGQGPLGDLTHALDLERDD